MEIKYGDIVLRDMRESDIEDWIRWYNDETEWADWDAPDEAVEPVDPDVYRVEMREIVKTPIEGFRNFFELDTADGVHIGMVTSYAIDEKWQWISWQDAKQSGTFYHTLGIDICDSQYWGKGLGKQALAAFINYYLSNDTQQVCLQTWSGNVRMIRCAQRLGFVECHREIGNRRVRGGVYDGLTFKLDLDRFHKFLADNP